MKIDKKIKNGLILSFLFVTYMSAENMQGVGLEPEAITSIIITLLIFAFVSVFAVIAKILNNRIKKTTGVTEREDKESIEHSFKNYKHIFLSRDAIAPVLSVAFFVTTLLDETLISLGPWILIMSASINGLVMYWIVETIVNTSLTLKRQTKNI